MPIVREALGLVSYHAGNWAEALSELRAVRRMTRTDNHIAVIADAERALGRPERALDLAKEARGSDLPRDVEIELRIVAAGARRDMGQLDAAVVSLQGSDLDPAKRDPWSARLFYAYADNLAAAGREEEAIRWFLTAAEADDEDETDAADRAARLTAGEEPEDDAAELEVDEPADEALDENDELEDDTADLDDEAEDDTVELDDDEAADEALDDNEADELEDDTVDLDHDGPADEEPENAADELEGDADEIADDADEAAGEEPRAPESDDAVGDNPDDQPGGKAKDD
ncbi:hypothetical protein [Amycolatopsis acidicola]|uniref:hypothetical protein n=1 Tax=Amycolatopsis acidicola TaxID=2596893 RepID=UPI001FB70FDE|nr:hypothetical protein [Amycolatopsis acidicola]